MLTAKGETDDKVRGLDCGADDYMTKPFMTNELLARIRALIRRSVDNTDDGKLKYGDIMLDQSKYTVICSRTDQSVRLAEKEYKLLEYMVINCNQILTREQLVLKVWGYESDAEYNNVEVYMSFTRRKLNFIGSKVEIKSVRKLGYQIRYKDV